MLKKAVIAMLSIFVLCANGGTLNDGQIVPVLRSGMESHSSMKSLMLMRTETKDNAVWGELSIDGKFICYTLENNTKKIPTGTYIVTKTKKGFRLNGVQGRTNINIEAGNYPFESLGCIFVGTKKTPQGVSGSRLALLKLASRVSPPVLLVVS